MNCFRIYGFLIAKILLGAILIAMTTGGVAAYIWPNQALVLALSHLVGRPVLIGKISANLNHSLNFELNDVRVLNPSWASVPDMIDIGHLAGSLDLRMLLSGRVIFQELVIDDATLTLERNNQGLGNWKKPGAMQQAPLAPKQEARQSRERIPVILNLLMNNNHVIFHTSSGAVLTIDLKNLRLKTESHDLPITLAVDGAYNKLPVNLNIETQSFDALHHVNTPFEAKVEAHGNAIDAQLDLQLMDPVNADQATGTLHVDIKNIGAAAAYVGPNFNANWPLVLDAKVERQSDHWKILSAEGKFAGNNFSNSSFNLDEGKRLQPDLITTAFVFSSINATPLVPKQRAHRNSDKIEWIDAGRNPDTLVDADLTIGKAIYKSITLSDIHLRSIIAEGESGLSAITFHVFGGDVSGSLISTIEGQKSQIKALFALTHLQTDQVIQNLITDKKIINGNVDLSAIATAEGDTAQAIAHSLNGHIEMRMAGGNVRSWANHLAAQDIRAFFDNATEMTFVQCMKASVFFTDGIGQLSPFVLQTNDGSMSGWGSIDLPQNRIALLFQTDPKTTSALALDLPISIHGSLNDPQVGTDFKSTPPSAQQANKECK